MGRGLWEGRFVAEGEEGLIESSGRGKSDDIGGDVAGCPGV